MELNQTLEQLSRPWYIKTRPSMKIQLHPFTQIYLVSAIVDDCAIYLCFFFLNLSIHLTYNYEKLFCADTQQSGVSTDYTSHIVPLTF